jgi:Ca-activated chloride channel family protein
MRAMPTLLMLLVLATCAAVSQTAPAAPSPGQSDAGTTLKVDVKLVNVFVTVVDQNGAPVGGLSKDNFQVMEDGVTQNVAVFDRESELPLNIILAVDTSLSTRKDLPLELESARHFVHSILRPVDRLALYQFDEIVHEVVPFTSDPARVDRGIEGVRVGSATALYDALYLGASALEERKGRKVMVVITDGGDTASKVNYAEALRSMLSAEAIVYSIIVVPIASSAGRNTGGEHALIQISHDTGGKFFYAEDGRQLDQVFRKIDQELRTQYLLAYYPNRRLADSDFRRIDVKVVAPNNSPDASAVRARHRTGYYTSPMK